MNHNVLSKLLFFSLILLPCNASDDHPRAYIIHMDVSAKPSPLSNLESWHMSILSSISSSKSDEKPATHLYSYNHVIQGFSAVLTLRQLENIKQVPGHVATYADWYGKLHTTHTPKFLGLSSGSNLWPASNYGNGMIIGMIDTGIWPESQSFNDDGMPPVPERWKGTCVTGTEFNSSLCNRKLIGARYFSKGLKQAGINISNADDYESPRDYEGHGSHTSSTAAGSPVSGANYFGYAPGTAIGMAPKAHIAMYKVLFAADTWESAATDVLAGMDQAIIDGVDLMSLSLGFFKTPYYDDIVAMGAFAALKKGVFVSCSAGNGGPHAYTIINGAPWLTSVGAGKIDREFVATVNLGDGDKIIRGLSVYPERLFVSNVSLYYGLGNTSKEYCSSLSLDKNEVAGKIVFCTPTEDVNVYSQIDEVSRVEAEGAIFASDLGEFLFPTDYFMPFVMLGTKPAPKAASFSSRGPSRISPGILKPDILAPGINILAAWAPNRAFAPIGDDYLVTDYALVSGTSMASPHIIGIAAIIKSVHRNWSSAAIRSAMMTTADIADNTGKPIIDMYSGIAGSPLEYGAGHVNPNKAMDPGLVYDITVQDYIDFLCGLNYTSLQIGMIIGKANYTCIRANLDLNYPSFMVILNNTNTTTGTFKRVLTNVGSSATTSYSSVVRAPAGMKVCVEPQTLIFNEWNSTQEFTVRVDIDLSKSTGPQSEYLGNYGYLSWYEIGGKHAVTSPIVSALAP
ncbi:putative tripeptidyl-peptidase II [Dioscorea sansibarensis]